MKIWNLTEFDELHEEVLAKYAVVQKARRPKAASGSRTRPLKLVVGVAALAAITVVVGDSSGTSTILSMPRTELAAVAHNVDMRPPLDSVFRNRFTESFTEADENRMLLALESARTQPASSPVDQVVDTIYSNQQERLDEKAPRLSREKVRSIVASRKIVK